MPMRTREPLMMSLVILSCRDSQLLDVVIDAATRKMSKWGAVAMGTAHYLVLKDHCEIGVTAFVLMRNRPPPALFANRELNCHSVSHRIQILVSYDHRLGFGRLLFPTGGDLPFDSEALTFHDLSRK